MMGKRSIVIAALLSAVLCADGKKEIVVLHTNDMHSTVTPIGTNIADTMKAGKGGMLRMVAMVKEERKRAHSLLLFDSGDFSQGSPYYNLYGGDVEIELMNRMGYDAAAIGNHEFDLGLENMARLFRQAHFPIVCANYDFTNTPVEGLVKPYVTIEREGMKIGVFGVSPRLSGLVAEKNCQGVKFLDPINAAIKTVKTLKEKEKCDYVICLSHLGWSVKPDVDDSILVVLTQGIDLVLGGHSHSYFEDLKWIRNAAGHKVPIDQNGKDGVFVGKMTLSIRNRK